MSRGSNDLAEAPMKQRQNAQSGEVVEGSAHGPGLVTVGGPAHVSPGPQQSPVAATQLSTQNPLQHFMVTGGQVQQVQVQQVPVQNVTLASTQQVTSPRAGQPQQLLAHMAGLRLPGGVGATSSSGGGAGCVAGSTSTVSVTSSGGSTFSLTPGAAAVLSQHGLTTQALSRLYATTVTRSAGQHPLPRHLAAGSAGMMVVPQLSPIQGFQQMVTGHSPTASTSGHSATTALLLTPAQDERELQIARSSTTTPPATAQPVTQMQLTSAFPATSTVSASGGTIHHHGRSPTRGGIPPLANPVQHQPSHQNLIVASMNPQQQQPQPQLAAAGASPTPQQTLAASPGLLPSSSSSSPSPSTASPSPGCTQPPVGGLPGAALCPPTTTVGGAPPPPPSPLPPPPASSQSVRRLSASLSPGVSPPRTSPLLAFGQLQAGGGAQRTSPLHSPERGRKRLKLEEVPATTAETASLRKVICDEKIRQMKEVKENYNEHLTELFFLQNGGNSMDYHAIKKRPTVQLLHFLKSGNLDSDDDDPVGTETKINDEVKVITTSGGTMPLATPVAISTTLPPAITAMQQQGNTDPGKKLGGRHGMVFGHVQPTTVQQTLPQIAGRGGVAVISPTTPVTSQTSFSLVLQSSATTTTTTTTTAAAATATATTKTSASTSTISTTSTTTPNLASQLAMVMADTSVCVSPAAVLTTVAAPKAVTHSVSPVAAPVTTTMTTVTTPSSTALGSLPAIKLPKGQSAAAVGTHAGRLATRQHSISAYNTAIGSQEAIVERAKQEAQVMQRVAELRKEGLWSSRRLPKVQEPPRNKAHWDYLLEEMQWLAADFAQERKWKKAGAKKIARMIMKYFQEQQQKELRAEKEEANRTKRIASNMAKMVKEFWSNIEKVVQYKQQSRLEEKRKKALDLHLSFIVDQTEKYSSWLTEGLQCAANSSIASSSVPTSPRSVPDDGDFEPARSESDDEETIAMAEQELQMDESAQQEELTELERESLMPIDELINSLPPEILEKPASLEPSDHGSEYAHSEQSSGKDREFNASDESEEDMEDTIAAQEKLERKTQNHAEELADLEAEGDLTVEELYLKYAAAYSDDFNPDMSDMSTDVEDATSGSSEEEESEEEDDEEEEEVDEKDESDCMEDIGMEYLFNPAGEEQMELEEHQQRQGQEPAPTLQAPPMVTAGNKSPGKDITDIAATALSLQPTGYTLETTRVITPVPFLLKHTLREYQHVGLDWLATMHDRKLNGILADEMGLGKTIQTIALLAHLACEKEVWGPHLIVVPTSVMLNWEMEIKKWCPAFKILTYYGNQKERKAKRTGWTKTNAFHVCITSYKLVIQDHQAFRRKKWKYFILDEAQNIKNFKSQRWQTLLNFQSQRRLLLTGTPLQNSLMELWSLMHFLMPHVFASHREFKEWFSNPLTGMVEGSREYNESLIKRLHKVLRPFLLRRLKADVEKQMPKKYEHVVMCRLSKRQRYLYDDFMAQSKTKETLASGHFMSVINILMQLRKVCNHPNLFDPRPVISSFKQSGISYTAASLVLRALEKHPLEHLSPNHLHPCLADLEVMLPAFAAHRIRKLQTPKSIIEEIDDQPIPSARPKPLQKPIKLDITRCQSPLPQSQASPKSASRPGSPVAMRTSAPTLTASLIKPTTATPATPTSTTQSHTVTPPMRVVTPMQVVTTSVGGVTTPAAVTTTQLVQLPGHTPTTASMAQARMASTPPQSTLAIVTTTAGGIQQAVPITVQMYQTGQGTRLMIPSGQLSQLPAGFLQIVQTANGPQIIATQQPTQPGQTIQITPSSHPVINGPTTTTTTVSSPSPSTLPSSTMQVVRTATTAPRPAPSLNLPAAVTTVGGKPVVRVSPLTQSTTTTAAAAAATTVTTSIVKAAITTATPGTSPSSTAKPSNSFKALQKLKQSPFYLEDLEKRRIEQRAGTLEHIAHRNKRHCMVKPVYGQDLFQAVNIYKHYNHNCDKTRWRSLGYLHCQDVHVPSSRTVVDRYWRTTHSLFNIVRTPEQYLHSLKDILQRFVFYIPHVTAPRLTMHASHPPPSLVSADRMLVHRLHRELAPKTAMLHQICTSMTVQCPEARLIQYDCGKLQTLDLLLRELKSGQHRVLIFTQMTKMLDVLESFLNYHGHRYLRLDGTTHIEQRQILMDRFNMDKRIFVFILSTRSGGIGVNLTGADTVIFYDSDWNPTMDAQAQDRCHRIGQTRDVHIYRLISERTVEENILKKANQKRLLGDVAIEGGNFTTAFFQEKTIKELFTEKENTMKELFAEPSGLHQLAKEKETARLEKEKASLLRDSEKEPKEELNTSMTQEQIEQALSKVEDETDVQAAKVVDAEQKAELAEFDENIPWDEKEEASRREEEDCSKVEQELSMLEKELTSVERYAVGFMEGLMSPLQEELERAEEEVALAKEEWELTRLKALRQEEERRAELEEDEMLFTYSRHDANNQVYVCDETGEQLPIWSPPTPPQDDNDVYMDQTICFLYEPTVMPESQLPQIYVKKEHKRIRIEAHAGRKPKVRKDDQPRVPRSLFDRPSAALRRDAKQLVKLKQQGMSRLFKPALPSSAGSRPLLGDAPEHPDWLIHEDWALLQAVQNPLGLPLNLTTTSPAHIANWDFVANVVNVQSRTYRSPKQCKNRYENVIVPREEGKILYDINPRKQKKSKGIYKTKNNRPMRTSQLFGQDNNGSITTLYTLRFDSSKSITVKRTPTLRPTPGIPTAKNPKHAAVLAESGISYDTPMTPTQVATIRAERIAKEKKQAAALAAQEQLAQQTAATTVQPAAPTSAAEPHSSPAPVSAGSVAVMTASTGQPQMTIVPGQPLTPVATTAVLQAGSLPKATVTAVSLARSLGATGSIVVNTAGGVSGNTFATINKRVSQSVAGTAIQVATTIPRTLTQQTLTAAIANQQRVNAAAAAAAASAGPTCQVLTTTTLTPGTVVAQRLGTVTATSMTPGTVQQGLTTTTRPLTPQHQLLLKRTYVKQQQQQQLRQAGRLPPTIQKADQLKQQQQMKQRLHAVQQQQVAAAATPTVVSIQKPANITTPLITSAAQSAQQVTQARLQAPNQKIKRTITEAEMAALIRRQQQQLQQKVLGGQQQAAGSQQLAGAQIISGPQVGSVSQPVATLVKTVSSPSGSSMPSVTIPVSAVSLGISVSVPQQKATTSAKVTQQQLRQIQQLQLPQRKVALQQAPHKVPSLTPSQMQQMQKAQLAAPLIIQQQQQQQIIKHPLNPHQLQQILQQQKASQQAQQAQVGTIQQIITSVAPPTTVIFTQGQAQSVQAGAKMALGTTPLSTHQRPAAPVTVTALPAANTVTVVSHGAPGASAHSTLSLTAPAVTLTPSPQATLVKHVHEALGGSPGKALPVTQATMAQIKAVQQQQVAAGRQAVGTPTVHVTQVPGGIQTLKAPSMAVQQAVQQVQAQARQQAAAAAQGAGSVSVAAVPSATTMVQVTQQGQVVQAVSPAPGTVTPEQQKAAQQASTTYGMRLRTQQKH